MANPLAVKSVSLPSMPVRASDGHKGTFGKVIIVGGSVGMSGSVCLASVAALRSGSGLVTAAVPQSIQAIVAGYEPSVMTIGLKDNAETGLHGQPHETIDRLVEGRDAIGVGPGLGRSSEAADLLSDLLIKSTCPVIVDADGLNIAAEKQLLMREREFECVVTPHPGEFARLTGRTIPQIEAHRAEFAQEFAREHRLIVALKGPGTIVTDGTRIYCNATGNSGMGTGGSGDVLTGIVASLLGQGLPAFEATALAVYAHGLAGDIAAERFTQRGMIASDLLTCLPEAWRRLEA